MSVSGFRSAENGGDDIQMPNEVILCSNGSNEFPSVYQAKSEVLFALGSSLIEVLLKPLKQMRLDGRYQNHLTYATSKRTEYVLPRSLSMIIDKYSPSSRKCHCHIGRMIK